MANSPQTTEVQPLTVGTRPKPNNFLVILLSVLLLLSVSIAGFFAFQTQKLVNELTVLKTKENVVPVVTPEPESTFPMYTEPTADPTANWKTYTNTKYNFSFKYPSDFKINEMADEVYSTAYRGTIINSGPIDPFGKSLSITFSSRSNLNDPDAACEQNDGVMGRCADYKGRGVKFNKESSVINNSTGIYVQTNEPTAKTYYLRKTSGSKVVEVGLWNGDSTLTKNDIDTLDQILSTFKFTN